MHITIVQQAMNHDKPYFSNMSGINMLIFMTNNIILYLFINKTLVGTRLCGWFFAGCWCALNRNSLSFSVIFTFSSLQPILKRKFQMCSVQSFLLIIVNQFMVIIFTLIAYYRMRYVFTKLPKNNYLE